MPPAGRESTQESFVRFCPLDRREHREPLACLPQVQRALIGGFADDAFDPCAGRTVTAQRDHLAHHGRRTREQRLDAAVPTVAHPTLKSARDCLMLPPGTVADALHPAPDRYLKDRAAHCFLSPRNSSARAFASASRIRRLVSCAAGNPFSSFGGVPSRNAFSVS